MRSVGDAGVELHVAVDRTGVHDERVRLDAFDVFLIDPEEPGIFVDAREKSRRLPLVLDAQEIDHVGALERLLQPVADLDADFFEFARHQRGGPGEHDFRAELEQPPHVAPGDPAVEDVADDRDFQALDAALLFTDREDVEQGLRRVAVRAVPGVDDAAGNVARDEVLRAGRAVPHDQEIDLQRLDVAYGIQQRLAFGETAGRGAHIDDVGAQPLFGQLERHPRAGRGFDEEVHHRLAAERGDFLHVPRGDFLELLGGVEDVGDLLCGEIVQTQQVFAGPAEIRGHLSPPTAPGRRHWTETTVSSPSFSISLTTIFRSGATS